MKNRLFIYILLFLLTDILILGLYLGFYYPDNKKKTFSVTDCPGCNIVVILVDTLRADHLPVYGYKKNTAPFISDLINKSTKFENAFSASSWTAPATASIFTSMMPSSHGITTGFAATKHMKNRKENIELTRIPSNLQTLGQFMQDSGYSTIGVADNLNIGKEMGFDRGFEYFKKYNDKGVETVNQTAREFIQSAGSSSKPIFLYLHYMDPHAPYRKRKPWFTECAHNEAKTVDNRLMCAYDSEINFLDSHIAEFVKEQKFLDNSIIFFMSDHGEEFNDHGSTGHGKTLYTEMIHVPFSMYHPNRTAQMINTNVHTFDLIPTIAGLINAPLQTQWQGIDLFSESNSGTNASERLIFSERLRNKDSRKDWWLRSVIRDKWQLINTENMEGMVGQELFDLLLDFAQLNNLVKSKPEVVKDLSEKLGKLDMSKTANEQAEVELDKELFDQLKSLGYVN